MGNYRTFVYGMLTTCVAAVGLLWGAEAALADYPTKGFVYSTNLLEGEGNATINGFSCTVSALADGTGLRAAFSRDGSRWFNSSGTAVGWDTLSAGANTIDLSGLFWVGTSFYYKLELTSTGSGTPVIDDVSLDYTAAFDGVYQEYSASGSLTSTNLLSGATVGTINSFAYVASAIPANTAMKVRFSQDGSGWVSADGTADAWESMLSGSNTVDLTPLSWTGASLYYQLELTSDGSDTPVLDSIDVSFDSPEVCGNGIIDPGEECDDGNTESGDGCSAACAVESGYTCEGEPSVCTLDCGDGILDPGEECDDGNTESGDGCSAVCQVEAGYSCYNDPMPSVCYACGDGIIDPGEECDDGNSESGDGCSDTCSVEHGFSCEGEPSTCSTTCGDGVVGGDEECDDGNTSGGDGCSAECRIEEGYTCVGEPSVCSVPGCGNAIIDPGEECDDGNINNHDGCTNGCVIASGWSCIGEPSVCYQSCGNGIVEPEYGEECDDGNTSRGDGCSRSCRVESNFSCEGSPSVCSCTASAAECGLLSCGDGMIDAGEVCDDGNTEDGDGCSAACAVESGYTCEGEPSICTLDCGNGVIDPGEECDDGNTAGGDGCSAECRIEEGYTCEGEPSRCHLCGNGVVEYSEGCDDGNTESGDGCSANCQIESGWVCGGGNPSRCTRTRTVVASPAEGGGGGTRGSTLNRRIAGASDARAVAEPVRQARTTEGSLTLPSDRGVHAASPDKGDVPGRQAAPQRTALPSVAERRNLLSVELEATVVMYHDVPADAWYASYVQTVVAEGIAQGYKNEDGTLTGEFGSNKEVTYAEALKMVFKATDRALSSNRRIRNTSIQADDWAAPYVATAEHLGLTVFRPELPVHRPATRGDVFQIVLEAYGIPVGRTVVEFDDLPRSHPGAAAIATAVHYGIIEPEPTAPGRGVQFVRPNDPLTRAEIAKIIVNARKLLR